MAAQTTSSIAVAASPAAIMAVIADLEAYPEWTASVREVEVLTVYPAEPLTSGEAGDEMASGRPATAKFVLDAGPIKDRYTLSYEWNGDDEVRWNLVEGGLIKELAGSYSLRAGADGTTEVTYQLTVDVAIPMLGLMKRKAEKVIIDTALKELKKRVEDGVDE
ncbi:SRPBCC family protein [Jiangella asiatica]|uniref:SRPBCC family protein n=1 Tax=Jiangella asiatica TaxID=2530372 RepID=A0A4R5CHU2_9ACTN|nr:SRPBCC family protein [Jiangella asiatica]TDD96872.1 SRPBCC family protein [Jiangella asiatica]